MAQNGNIFSNFLLLQRLPLRNIHKLNLGSIARVKWLDLIFDPKWCPSAPFEGIQSG